MCIHDLKHMMHTLRAHVRVFFWWWGVSPASSPWIWSVTDALDRSLCNNRGDNICVCACYDSLRPRPKYTAAAVQPAGG